MGFTHNFKWSTLFECVPLLGMAEELLQIREGRDKEQPAAYWLLFTFFFNIHFLKSIKTKTGSRENNNGGLLHCCCIQMVCLLFFVAGLLVSLMSSGYRVTNREVTSSLCSALSNLDLPDQGLLSLCVTSHSASLMVFPLNYFFTFRSKLGLTLFVSVLRRFDWIFATLLFDNSSTGFLG